VAKKSMLAKNEERKRLVAQFRARREELLKLIKDPDRSVDDKLEAYTKLAKMPRNASPVRVRNRCGVNGRPRGYLRRFNMSRVQLRELALQGKVPGVTKSSW
jgi:small subunit ribosomal protein S14